MGTRWPETCWATYKGEINIIPKVTSSWSLYPHVTTCYSRRYHASNYILTEEAFRCVPYGDIYDTALVLASPVIWCRMSSLTDWHQTQLPHRQTRSWHCTGSKPSATVNSTEDRLTYTRWRGPSSIESNFTSQMFYLQVSQEKQWAGVGNNTLKEEQRKDYKHRPSILYCFLSFTPHEIVISPHEALTHFERPV